MSISSELEEIARCSTKVMVMHDMKVSNTLAGDYINETPLCTPLRKGTQTVNKQLQQGGDFSACWRQESNLFSGPSSPSG